MKKLRDLSQSAHQWLIDHATVAAEPKTKQPKRRQSKKKESTVDGTIDPNPAIPRPATKTIAENEGDPRLVFDQKMLAVISRRKEVAIKRKQDLLKVREESSSKAVAFIPPRTATVAENEDDDDIQIIKVVKDPMSILHCPNEKQEGSNVILQSVSRNKTRRRNHLSHCY
ncbi:hypothetical protein LIER_08886 [Lithospermum erythrorhizon]|uniref:Uncharacterized protein n=1 Tax=Lithospermum erythrorhizon TaxID=34254 RepID=A0AAV3PDS6_LITER